MAKKDEKFSPNELTAIQSVLEKLGQDQIEFDDAGLTVDRLIELWGFSLDRLAQSECIADLEDERLPAVVQEVAEPEVLYSRVPEPTPPPEALRKDEWFLGMSDEFVKAIQGMDRKLQGRILEAISYIVSRPTESKGDTVKPLGGELKGFWRYRIGDYRLVYQPETQSRRVLLVTFTSRAGAYN